ncbi:hypothetical protein BJ878DRAFT_205997 [Calycina marina]|uniref:SRR1-like domain-containing protein n=1 Tax=Calycina marina TaxID=1763456 RepID=A0A9P7YXN2_9HELO|nr:hypothetical protein BJ878DRAFT_205997 [Calycina marina]
MPHNNRPQQNTARQPAHHNTHTRRTNVEDSEGWTHVMNNANMNRCSGRRGDTHKQNAQTQQSQAGDNSEKYQSGYTVEMLTHELDLYSTHWRGHKVSDDLKNLFKDSDSVVNNIVVIGLGSLHNARFQAKNDSWSQLIAMRDIVDFLGPEVDVPIVFQDPAFSDIDREFLASIGYKVVNAPDGWMSVGPYSLVYGIHCYNDVLSSVVEDSRPAMMIRNTVDPNSAFWDPFIHGSKAYHADLIKDYFQTDFPQPENSNAFTDTKIYWRKASCKKGLCKFPAATVTTGEVK